VRSQADSVMKTESSAKTRNGPMSFMGRASLVQLAAAANALLRCLGVSPQDAMFLANDLRFSRSFHC
jgi:hypothetical protein